MTAVLFVVTGSDHWTLADGTLHPTGYWAENSPHPTACSARPGSTSPSPRPGGVAPTVDAVSLAAESTGGKEQADAIAAYLASIRADLENPVKLEEVDLDEYAAVFYPGGHGPMEDLAVNAASGRLLTAALDSGKPLARAVPRPRGPARRPARGRQLAVRRYRLTGFTNDEETRPASPTRPRGCSRTAWWNSVPTSTPPPRSPRTSWRTAICTPARTPPPPSSSPGTSSAS